MKITNYKQKQMEMSSKFLAASYKQLTSVNSS